MKGIIFVLLLIFTNKFALADKLKTRLPFGNGGTDSNQLLDIIQRIEQLETSDDDNRNENKKLQTEVTNLKTYISFLKAENEKTVSDLQSQITNLHAKNRQNEILIKSLVSARQPVLNKYASRFPSQHNFDDSRNEDIRNNMTAPKPLTQTSPQDEWLHGVQKEWHPNTNDSTQGHRTSPILKRSVGLTRNRILRAENDVLTAFYATVGSHHIEHAGVNQNIVFDNVITNLGNAYNKFAGDFRAPVSGTYVFSVTLMAYATHSTHYHIAKNGSKTGNIYLHGKDWSDATSSVTAVLQLKQGDVISIKNDDADEFLHGYDYSTFSGFLLQQDYSTATIVGK